MDKEHIIESARYGGKAVKDFTVRQYHSLADFLARKKSESQANGCCLIFGMNFIKLVFIFMNLFYLLMGLFMVLMGSSSYYAVRTFYTLSWLDIKGLSIIWVISGGLLASISIFGIIGAFKESVAWSNIYGVLLCITFFLQIFTSIAAYCLVATGTSSSHAPSLIYHLMRNYYSDDAYAHKMDYIQQNFKCCGANGPSDWDKFSQYEYQYDYDILAHEIGASTTVESLKYKTPASCCIQNEKSDYENNTCTEYFKKGCTLSVTELVTETVLIVASVLLAIGVLQILGIVISFMLARMFRRASTYRNIQKFSSQYGRVFDVPSHADYQRLHNSTDAVDNVN